MRFRIPPGDVPIEQAARHLGLSLERFRQVLPDLIARDFPAADKTTGNFDLDAIDEWRRRRYPRPFRPANAPDDGPTEEEVLARIARLRAPRKRQYPGSQMDAMLGIERDENGIAIKNPHDLPEPKPTK